MARRRRRKPQKKHWTEDGAVKLLAFTTAILMPILGLLVSVPCLVAARNAGTPTGPYAIAVALNVVLVALGYAAARLIQPT
jgi:hypothetical protein